MPTKREDITQIVRDDNMEAVFKTYQARVECWVEEVARFARDERSGNTIPEELKPTIRKINLIDPNAGEVPRF